MSVHGESNDSGYEVRWAKLGSPHWRARWAFVGSEMYASEWEWRCVHACLCIFLPVRATLSSGVTTHCLWNLPPSLPPSLHPCLFSLTCLSPPLFHFLPLPCLHRIRSHPLFCMSVHHLPSPSLPSPSLPSPSLPSPPFPYLPPTTLPALPCPALLFSSPLSSPLSPSPPCCASWPSKCAAPVSRGAATCSHACCRSAATSHWRQRGRGEGEGGGGEGEEGVCEGERE